VIDLTSPDYSLAGQELKVDARTGNDVIWGSDANETLIGNEGDDVLFGGAGINILIGGTGADEFQFSATSNNDSITDFDLSQGDTLKFFNTGGAEFDKDSIKVNDTANGIAIDFLGAGSVESLNIPFGLDAFSLSDSFFNSVEILI
jgi:Ca2+-binding RTX toxin-like protein